MEVYDVFMISESAATQIKNLLAQELKTQMMLRVVVESGGCSGFQYKYEFTDVVDDTDIILTKEDVKVVVDNVSMEFLKGSELQFIKELGASYFKISNPNATAKCGCGNSFNV
ncbi:MAG: iron-sulfur cluster insertion protein ErpA [Rickettsiaceae bacterium]|nr:iron-sulfur cluster insertion protein ErpA [Rickettsiaceae bacterium]